MGAPAAGLFLLYSAVGALAGGAGTTSAEFLKIQPAPVPASMGDAYVSIPGADSILYNPAGLALNDRKSISASRLTYVMDYQSSYLSVVVPDRRRSAIGAFGSLMTSGPIASYDDNDIPLPSVKTQHGVAGVAYAYTFDIWARPPRKPGARIAVGAAPKVIYEKLAGISARAYAVDLGVMVDTNYGARYGMSVQNLGSKEKFIQEAFALPVIYRVGASYSWRDRNYKATVAGDAILSGTDPSTGAFGFMTEVFHALEFRAGYRLNREMGAGMTMGVGLLFDTLLRRSPIRGLRIDYGYVPGAPFEVTHRVGVQLQW